MLSAQCSMLIWIYLILKWCRLSHVCKLLTKQISIHYWRWTFRSLYCWTNSLSAHAWIQMMTDLTSYMLLVSLITSASEAEGGYVFNFVCVSVSVCDQDNSKSYMNGILINFLPMITTTKISPSCSILRSLCEVHASLKALIKIVYVYWGFVNEDTMI